MTPHLLEKITDAQGRVVETYQPTRLEAGHVGPGRRPDHPADAGGGDLGHRGGDGFPASLNVAVKTGTAQIGTPTSPRSPTG